MSLFDRAVVSLLPLIPKPVIGRFSRRYIAGTNLAEALETVRSLERQGMRATLDVLGENVTSLNEAEVPRNAYLDVLRELHRTGIDSNVSVKLTQIGLLIDPEACYRNIRAIVSQARELGNFVRLDMEDSSCTTATLRIYRRLREEFENVGVVLQAMLRRTLADAEELVSIGANVRLCKGIYVEPRRLAYRDRELVNRNYALILERLLAKGCYVGIATHDEQLVWEGLRLINELNLGKDRYEFQMLLGVDEELRSILVEAGHPLRVYVPFGERWYAYSVRRLRENPRIAGYVAKSVLKGQGRARPR